jgi:hypothetical protein
MSPEAFHDEVLGPGLGYLQRLAPSRRLDTPQAVVLLLAIAAQESGLTARRQIGGPARGFWQFEQGGGVNGVLTNSATRSSAAILCSSLSIPVDTVSVYESIAWNDHLATGFARLLLWSDTAPLPNVGEADAGWAMYLRNWRPGRPRPADWPGNYALAMKVVAGPTAA